MVYNDNNNNNGKKIIMYLRACMYIPISYIIIYDAMIPFHAPSQCQSILLCDRLTTVGKVLPISSAGSFTTEWKASVADTTNDQQKQ